MPPKADAAALPSPPAETGMSGKFVIIGIVTVALLGAGGSWWFRYSSTHETARFWGPLTATMIRDAPEVSFSTFSEPITNQAAKFEGSADGEFANVPQAARDVTEARGLVHLRNALLESHNFKWPSVPTSSTTRWTHALVFTDKATGRKVCVLFAPESKLVASTETNTTASFEPISSGIAQMFGEFESLPTSESPATGR